MGNRAPDAIAALRAYAREIEADAERFARAPQTVSHSGGATMPSASVGARFIAPLVIVSAVVVGLAGSAVVLLGYGTASPPVAGPQSSTTAAPALQAQLPAAMAERAVLRLRSAGLETAADSVEDAVTQGIGERADVQAAIASFLAVVEARTAAGVTELSSDPVVLAATEMLTAVVRPPGLDPNFTPPGLGGTPPGLDPDFIPPGQDEDFIPPGQDEDFTPPGRAEDRTPPGQDLRTDR